MVSYPSERAHLLWVRMCLRIRLSLSEVPEELGKEEKQDMECRALIFSFCFSLGRTRGFNKLGGNGVARAQ